MATPVPVIVLPLLFTAAVKDSDCVPVKLIELPLTVPWSTSLPVTVFPQSLVSPPVRFAVAERTHVRTLPDWVNVQDIVPCQVHIPAVSVTGPDQVPLRLPPPPPDALKVAVTDWLEFMVTLQDPLPEHGPPQPQNNDPAVGVAVRVTDVPDAYA